MTQALLTPWLGHPYSVTTDMVLLESHRPPCEAGGYDAAVSIWMGRKLSPRDVSRSHSQ